MRFEGRLGFSLKGPGLCRLDNLVLSFGVSLEHVVGDQLLFSLTGEEVVEDGFTACWIGRQGNLINITQPSKGLDACLGA